MEKIDFSKKFNFKIRDKHTGKFVTPTYGSRKKVWQRPFDVIEKFRESTSGRCNTLSRPATEYEVVLFPVEEGVPIDADLFIKQYRQHRQQKEENKNLSKERREKNKVNDLIKKYQKMDILPSNCTKRDILRELYRGVYSEEIQKDLNKMLELVTNIYNKYSS